MSDDGWLRLSTLEHFAYCPRQAYLLLDGVWADNHLTVTGSAAHSHVDEHGTDHRRGVKVHHRVEVAHRGLRIYGVADSVEEANDGSLVPVEHKLGRAAGDLFPSTVQVVSQALCLEDMTGRPVTTAAVYVVSERRRERISVDEHRASVLDVISNARSVLGDFVEAHYSPRLCPSCSIGNACQPTGSGWQ